MPEGTIVCNVEEKAGDRGSLARCSGAHALPLLACGTPACMAAGFVRCALLCRWSFQLPLQQAVRATRQPALLRAFSCAFSCRPL